jgi:inorganic pyrophosphatase
MRSSQGKFLLLLIFLNFVLIISKIKKNKQDLLGSLTTLSNNKKGKNFRMYLLRKMNVKSFWHYISLKNYDKTFNMIVEIPKNTRAKMEMSKEEAKNPIKQDMIKNTNKLRFYKIDPIFNYGYFPQTWENSVKTYFGKYKGDDDPYDVVELGSNTYKIGDVIKVKILGSFCLIDHGEVDWKILVINEDEYKDCKDRKQHFKRVFKDVMQWFKLYKVYEGKKENKILFNNKIFSVKSTKKLIEEGYQEYLLLKNKKIPGIDYVKYNF